MKQAAAGKPAGHGSSQAGSGQISQYTLNKKGWLTGLKPFWQPPGSVPAQ
jgi:hypothetical protein